MCAYKCVRVCVCAKPSCARALSRARARVTYAYVDTHMRIHECASVPFPLTRTQSHTYIQVLSSFTCPPNSHIRCASHTCICAKKHQGEDGNLSCVCTGGGNPLALPLASWGSEPKAPFPKTFLCAICVQKVLSGAECRCCCVNKPGR